MSMFDEPCKRCNSRTNGHDIFMICWCKSPEMQRYVKLDEEIEDTVERLQNGTYNRVNPMG